MPKILDSLRAQIRSLQDGIVHQEDNKMGFLGGRKKIDKTAVFDDGLSQKKNSETAI
jgi:hypothetical protein